MNTKTASSASNEFLVAEYEMLREFRRDSIQLQEHRLTAYLVAVGGAISIVGIALQAKDALTTYHYLIPFALFLLGICLFFFGVLTFKRMILRSAEIVLTTRAMDAIRNHYIKQDSSIEKALVLHKYALCKPSLANQGPFAPGPMFSLGLPQIIAMLNSFIGSLGTAIYIRLAVGFPTKYGPLIASFVFIYCWATHFLYYKSKIRTLQADFENTLGNMCDFHTPAEEPSDASGANESKKGQPLTLAKDD